MTLSRRALLLSAMALGATRARAATGHDADIIVVGAGLAGLAAALALEEAGAKVLVVEGQRRIGGKMLSFRDVPGVPEAGGQSIGPGYGRLINAARRFGVELDNVLGGPPERREVELVLDGTVVRKADWPSSPRNPFPEGARGTMPWSFVGPVMERANPLQQLDDWYGPANAQHDVSMHAFLTRAGVSEAAIALAYDTNCAYGTSAHDISALQMCYSEFWARLQRQIRPAAVYKARGGNQRIPEAMAGALKTGVELGATVVAVEADATGASVQIADGRRLRARGVILALPFSTLRQIAITPRLTGVQAEAVKTLPHQAIVQFALLAKRPFWREDGLAPAMWCEGLLARVFPHYAEGADPVSFLVTAYGHKASALDRLGRDAAARTIIAEFERARPSARGQLEVVGHHSWGLDPYAAGDWAVFAPGTVTRFLPAMSMPAGRLHFCGEQTALANRGMEGAMESGERAALETLDYL